MATVAAEAVRNLRRDILPPISGLRTFCFSECMSSSLGWPVEFGGHFLEMIGDLGAERRLLGGGPFSGPLAGLEAEPPARHQALEVGERPGCPIEVGKQVLVDIERQVRADEISAFEG